MYEHHRPGARRHAVPLVTASLLAALWGGAFHAKMALAESPLDQAQTQETSAEESTAEDAKPAAARGTRDLEGVEWLVDDEGKEYSVVEIPKGIEGRQWMWIDETTVQVGLGLRYEVLDHDEETFQVKVYRSTGEKSAPPPPPPPPPSEEELAKIAATYESGAESVDRLRLLGFDAGLPRRGQWRNGLDVADMNGDGHLDIVFGPARKGSPQPNLFLGDGRGRWRRWREARFPSLRYDYGDIAAADFNGDGIMDLALGIHLTGMLVLVGDEKGTFSRWSRGIEYDIPGQGGDASSFSSRAIEVTDWNSDGRPDLLALGEGPKGLKMMMDEGDQMKRANGAIFYLNNGDGSWTPKGKESRLFGDDLALGDFDGDGRQDFVTASNSLGYKRLLHLGQGVDEWEQRAIQALRPRALSRTVASGRLNGDEAHDLVVGYLNREDVWRTGVDVLYPSPSGGDWQRQTLYSSPGRAGIYSVATGDLDGDGRTDVAAANGHGEVMLFLAGAEGSYAREVSPELPAAVAGCRGYAMRLVDLDGDGLDELIVGFAGEEAGLPGVMGAGQPGCPGQGSLRVWSPVLRTGETEEETSKANR